MIQKYFEVTRNCLNLQMVYTGILYVTSKRQINVLAMKIETWSKGNQRNDKDHYRGIIIFVMNCFCLEITTLNQSLTG